MNRLNQQPPVCMVCGETNSTGYHCGAVTCEACKKFFQRNQEGEYKHIRCIRNTQNCVVTLSTRTNCPYCRYKKCEQVGMMKSNEKVPSQTVAFKKIPCSVCGDASSGLHFGVITCEGCKGFFRRNAKSSEKFICVANSTCEINVPNRNVCKSCRLNKCIEVGMNLKNSKIGRQTNLFKQTLISTIDKTDQNHHQTNETNSNQAMFELLYLPDIEDSLDLNTKMYIKTVFEAYKECFEINNNYIPYHGYFPAQYPEHKYVFDHLNTNMNNIYSFLYKISDVFKQMNQRDQYKVICNAIHPIRLLQLAYSTNNGMNYFNTDNQTFEAVARCFPVFASSVEFLNTTKEFIKSLKLDSKEFALYLALLAFSSGGHQFSVIQQSYALNLEICKALTAYMKLRRNEIESAEMLISHGGNFEKMNICLQRGVYDAFKGIEFCLRSDTILHKVIYSSFEIIE